MAKTVDPLFSKFEPKRENIIPILQVIQEEYTYLPEHMMGKIADFTHVPESDIYGVATFYAQFRFERLQNIIRAFDKAGGSQAHGNRILAPGLEPEEMIKGVNYFIHLDKMEFLEMNLRARKIRS